MEETHQTFSSVALYTRGEKSKKLYDIETDEWSTKKYFQEEGNSAGILAKTLRGDYLLVELSASGFYWVKRHIDSDEGIDFVSYRFDKLENISVSNTYRKPVPVKFSPGSSRIRKIDAIRQVPCSTSPNSRPSYSSRFWNWTQRRKSTVLF